GDARPRDVFKRLSIAGDDARRSTAGHARYDVRSEQRDRRSFALLNDFGAAIEAADQLSLVYQPRVDLATGERRGVEALLRWSHPELGSIPPGEFVPLVEQTALARPMTEWVIEEAIRQSRQWAASGLHLPVSINASALNLDEADFAERLLAAAHRGGVPASRLELEFTESAIARDPSRVADQLLALRSAGVAIAIDDFGTGYSNLSYLQKLPITVLKIDQSFVRNIGDSGKDRLLVKTMILMGHDLGYRVVAEGIETRPAYETLADWGCDEGQGYLMSRPVSAGVVQQPWGWLANEQVTTTNDARTA
ncbi:MAG: putative bifunctional diguanylate cyclase/phosphodiesterase, partial [Janthinobacterium lividum]